MKKLIALLCLFSLMLAIGCRTTVGPPPSLGVLDVEPWSNIGGNCELDREASVVICDRPYFQEEVFRSIDHYDAALTYSRDLEFSKQSRALDGDVSASRLADCKMKLNSPWRSPWLWGILALVAGGAAGFGLAQ